MKKFPKSLSILKIVMIFFLFSPYPLLAEELFVTLPDAVIKTLEVSPGVKAEKAKVDKERGIAQKASGEFDFYTIGTISREEASTPLTQAQQEDAMGLLEQNEETLDTFSIGVSKKLRNGIVIIPSISALDYENNTTQQDPLNTSDYNIEIVIPLIKGLGKKNTGAEEMAAKSNLNATELLSRHNISGRVFQTISSFWKSLTAMRNLEILSDSEKRANEILNLIEIYVKGGELEPALIRQAKAKLYQSRVDLKEGELNLYTSKQALAVSMGYTPNELPKAPLPKASFPSLIDRSRLSEELAVEYVEKALDRRGDYLANQININTTEILLQKAQNGLKPQLDLNVKAGYNGLDESYNSDRYHRSFSNNLGLNTFVGFSLSLPIQNNTAKGEFFYRSAIVEEAKLQASDLANNIASEVLSTLEALQSAIDQYELAKQSVENYKTALVYEKRKLKGGESNLTDLIDMEDRYFLARASENRAVREYAIALAKLRYVTGTLMDQGEKELRFKLKNVMTLP